jgi:hypothetical protein
MSRSAALRGVVLVAGAFAAVLVAAGCGTPQQPQSEIQTGPDGLRTFTWTRETGDVPILCNASAAVDPVTGVLRGDPSASAQPVWLETGSGRRLSVIWPAGFSVRFEPLAELRNESGDAVARDGDRVRLSQVGAHDNAGTFEDPYIASGDVFGRCYPYITRVD